MGTKKGTIKKTELSAFSNPRAGGIIAMGVLTTALFAGVSVVWDREFGFLRELLVAPLGRTGIVLGKALGACVVALLQVALMLLIAPIVGVRPCRMSGRAASRGRNVDRGL